MKYTTEIEINLPREKVIDLFDSTENMYKWQPDLISFEHVSGNPVQVGAKSSLKYKMGKREVEMIETITVRNLPDEFSGIYKAKNVWNQQTNKFIEVDENTTRWTTISEFRCKGFVAVMCLLMPGAFKKQTLKYMKQFKAFAEGDNA